MIQYKSINRFVKKEKTMNDLEMKLCEKQAEMFEMFADAKYDAESLVKAFMTSSLARDYDAMYNRMQLAQAEYLFEECIKVCKDELTEKTTATDRDALYWMGFVYRFWRLSSVEKSFSIYQRAPFELMMENYPALRFVDVREAVAKLIEITKPKKGNKKRSR